MVPTPAAFPQAPGRTTLQRLTVRRGPAVGSGLARRRFRTARLAARASLLAPRTFPRILDAACDAFAARFTACFSVSVLLWFPALFAEAVLLRNAPEVKVLWGVTTVPVLWSLAVPGLVGTLSAVFVCSLVGAYLAGRPAAAGLELLHGLARAPGSVVLALLTGFATTLGMCACFVPGIALRWLFAAVPAVYVLERATILGALGRSVTLSSGGASFLRWLGCSTIGWLMVAPFLTAKWALDLVPVRAQLEEYLALGGHSFDLAVAGLEAPLLAIGTAFAAVVRTVYYVDLRTRREGLDLELRLASLRAGAPEGAAGPDEGGEDRA